MRSWATLLLLTLLLTGCSRSVVEPPKSQYKPAPTITPPGLQPSNSAAPAPQNTGTRIFRDIKGTVATVDAAHNQIEINHEEIPGYMPAMLMYYGVKDPSLLKDFRVNDHVKFTIEDQNGTITLKELSKL